MYDLVVIGGGINGVAIACDAAGRGLSVLLCEKDDLASQTSSSSTKLIHGGLRYLEQYEFRLVRESLIEREVLLNKAPHIVWPLKLVMPHENTIRPYWMIRAGLFLYDHLGGRKKLPGSHGIRLDKHASGSVLQKQFKRGFVYSDCWVDDARLVVLTALLAQEKAATIKTRTRCVKAQRLKDHWNIHLHNSLNNEQYTVQCKMLINAAGPWVDDITQNVTKTSVKNNITLIKGSHIVVPKIHTDQYAYILQHNDKRVLFVIPYLDKYSLIGTTDMTFDGDPDNIEITDAEIDYLCSAINRYVKKPISRNDIIWSYSGVRPLKCDDADNPQEISRDYELVVQDDPNLAPMLSVYGGKITTHRKLAEHAMSLIKTFFPSMGFSWTEKTPLPGGDIPDANFDAFLKNVTKSYPNLPFELIFRLTRAYGTKIFSILKNAKTTSDLGACYGSNLFEAEVKYLKRTEFIVFSDDVLWRRTKCGLEFSPEQVAKLKHDLIKM